MAVPIQSRQRIDSPERWAKALQRALAVNPVYMELDDGAWAVSSSKDVERGYVTTSGTCTCEASRGGDPVCLHRALVRALTGVMPLEAEPPVVECLWCTGSGMVPNDYHQRYDECDVCGGSGVRVDARPADAPPVQPVATAA